MHNTKLTQPRRIKDLRRLADAPGAGMTDPPDAWRAVVLAAPLLTLNHWDHPLTDKEVGVMLAGQDGRHVVFITNQPCCLLDVLVGSGVVGVGYVDPACWQIQAPADLSDLSGLT